MSPLRDFFGTKRNEIWQQLSEEMNARFEAGTWRKGSRVQVDVGPWTVTLDIHQVSSGHAQHIYTRMRAPFVNADAFRFNIYRKGFFSGIAKALGMEDLEIGEPDFDEAFIIKASDASQVRTLFANDRIRRLLEAQPHVHFQVKDDEGWFGPKFPEGVDELCFEVSGTITDIPRLKQLFELFAEVLEQLCRMGSAYRGDPGLTL